MTRVAVIYFSIAVTAQNLMASALQTVICQTKGAIGGIKMLCSMRKNGNWMAVMALVSILLFSTNAFADTYNFYFSKPKKKQNKVNQDTGEKSDEESAHSDEDENEEQGGKTSQQKTEEVAGRTPIIINNHNTLNGTPREESRSNVSEAIAASRIPQVRFGVSAIYFPNKEIERSIFARNYKPFTEISDRAITYGGLLSLGIIGSHIFTLNTYFGAHHSVQFSKTLYHLGVDAEFYPFAPNIPIWEVSPFDFGFLVGTSTSFLSDGNLLSVHGGARLSINFSSKFGITAVARASVDHLMAEAGIITRL